MAVLKDFVCLAHGRFESMTGKCPNGCSDDMVAVRYFKAPGLTSDRTKNIDRTLQNLASDFGLTNINNQNGTSAAIRPDPKAIKEREQLMGKLGDTSGMWGSVTPGGTYKVGTGAIPVDGRSGQGAVSTIQSVGAMPGNALETVAPMLHPPVPNVVGRFDAKLE